ncbi:MAG TPA: hypothetical protein VGL72_19620 [Bryobacteraceae bacterium]|jgi:hypothetical protein
MIAVGIALAYGLVSLAVGLFVSAFIKAGAGHRPSAPERSFPGFRQTKALDGDREDEPIQERVDAINLSATVQEGATATTGVTVIGLLRTRVVAMARNRLRN